MSQVIPRKVTAFTTAHGCTGKWSVRAELVALIYNQFLERNVA